MADPIPRSSVISAAAHPAGVAARRTVISVLVVLGATVAAAGWILERETMPWAGGGVLALGLLLDLVWARRPAKEWLQLMATGAQVALLFFAIYTYRLESAALYERLSILIAFGFIAHHYLEPALRLPFFCLLSFAGIAHVLGPWHGAILVAAGGALIGACHLPIHIYARVGLLLAASGALAALRVDWWQSDDLSIILPILASMFMFRLAIYLYDVHHGKGPKGVWARLAYFFMLPNVVFPFFPVVDYATMGRTYYNDDALRIYQKGLRLILYGTVHLILYRIDNYYLAIAAEQVRDFPDLLRYMVTNFGLYLRISGLFHLIIGVMHLFGFNLPDTHTKYYLSYSFTEFWRRINIYWKDFMQKLFFNPFFMIFKKLGLEHMRNLMASMAVVFFLTWALHAYQWFWLRGTILFTAPDTLFWAILGLLLIVQTALDNRYVEPKAPRPPGLLGPKIFHALRTASAFLTICVLWSLWSAPTFGAWTDMVAAAVGIDPFSHDPVPLSGWLGLAAFTAFVVFIVALTLGFDLGLGPRQYGPGAGAPAGGLKGLKKPSFMKMAGPTTAAALGLVLVQAPLVYQQLGPAAEKVVLDVRAGKLSARDSAMMVQGYYENLTDLRLINSQLWEVHLNKPKDWHATSESEAAAYVDDYRVYVLKPNAKGKARNVTIETNRWAMRDKDYAQEKPAGACRVALVGASRAMGEGVEVRETFAWRLEDELNKTRGGHGTYELLNFSVGGYEQILRLMHLEREVFQFQPDAVLWVAADVDLNFWQLVSKYQRGLPLPFPELDAIASEAGLDRAMDKAELTRRLEPYRARMVRFVYQRVVEDCRAKGVLPIWLLLPEPTEAEGLAERNAEVRALAEEAGFAILDLSDVYAGQSLPSLWVAEWDHHPNAKGHLLITQALLQAMRGQPVVREALKLEKNDP
jgi:D-alanyl-lipoteichoic acid acyltransferase DltB (MBOAT superfamily)